MKYQQFALRGGTRCATRFVKKCVFPAEKTMIFKMATYALGGPICQKACISTGKPQVSEKKGYRFGDHIHYLNPDPGTNMSLSMCIYVYICVPFSLLKS